MTHEQAADQTLLSILGILVSGLTLLFGWACYYLPNTWALSAAIILAMLLGSAITMWLFYNLAVREEISEGRPKE